MNDAAERDGSRARQAFRRAFGREPGTVVGAPGRVNVIGEHTDYTGGLVLPCAIDRHTRVAAAARDDRQLRARSRELDAEVVLDLDALTRRGDWGDYVGGPAFALAERGMPIRGADLWIESDVARESGLSSSAALGVGVAAALAHVNGLGLHPRDWAELAHHGESVHVGVGCGIMDQFASALGRRGHVLRIDCRDRSVEAVPFPGDVRLLVAASGVERRLAEGGYRERVEECQAALAAARESVAPAAEALRDIGPELLPALESVLPQELLRRVRHVVTENARVDATCEALRAGDLSRVGTLLHAGQASLRDDYEVSTPELDALCELAEAQPGHIGSRLTGAGWGGCTLHLVEPAAAESIATAIAAGFEEQFGRRPSILVVAPAEGAALL